VGGSGVRGESNDASPTPFVRTVISSQRAGPVKNARPKVERDVEQAVGHRHGIENDGRGQRDSVHLHVEHVEGEIVEAGGGQRAIVQSALVADGRSLGVRVEAQARQREEQQVKAKFGFMRA